MLNYGEAMKQQREFCGLSQNKLAKLTNISQQNISYWESNKKEPSVIACAQLADFYGISIDELIGREIPQLKPTTKNVNQTIQNNHGTINNNF